MQPNHEEAVIDRETASHLVKRQKQLHSTDLGTNRTRFKVGDKIKCSDSPMCIEDKEHPDHPTLKSEDDSFAEKQSN